MLYAEPCDYALQDISGPAPVSDPLLANLERALMKDPY